MKTTKLMGIMGVMGIMLALNVPAATNALTAPPPAMATMPAQPADGTVSLPITFAGRINIFTNFPSTSPDKASFGISAGAVTMTGTLENYLGADLNLGSGTNFWGRLNLGGEIYNGPGSTVVDAADVELAFRAMVDPNYEVKFGGFGRKYFSTIGTTQPGYTGGGFAEFNWRILQGNNLFTQVRYELESPNQGDKRVGQTLKLGGKFYFPGW